MSGEASIGSFDVSDLNDGWHISAWSADGDEISLEEGDEIRFPCRPDLPLVTDMLLTNTLPEGIKDGMQLSFRTAMEDVEISIAGKLRSSYISEELPNKDYYLPSAYVVVELYDDDAGQEVEIHVKNKSGAEEALSSDLSYRGVLYSRTASCESVSAFLSDRESL